MCPPEKMMPKQNIRKIDLKALPPNIYQLLVEIGTLADAAHLLVFLVGGMVRDLVLKRPSVDVDIVVEGDSLGFASALAKRWSAKMLAHRKFGTAVITRADGLKIDVVMARRESYARPGALPDVVPGHLADDLFRRDFTINAVAVALNREEFGLVYDDFDGCQDILAGLIRVMHYRSFIDDPTRILRAVRYEKRFAFKLESRTAAILRQALEENVFASITPVRYFGEFKQLLQERDPLPALRRLAALDGLRFFVINAGVEADLKAVLKSGLEGDARWIGLFKVLISSLDLASAEELLASFNIPRSQKGKILKGLA